MVLAVTNERPPIGGTRPRRYGSDSAERRMRSIWIAHAGPLLRFLQRLNPGREHVAEDLLQETLMRAWRHLDKLPDDVDSLAPWLYTVARRIVIDAARARQFRPVEIALGEADREPVMADEFDQVVSAQVIRGALQRLTPEHQAVLIELYFRQHSTAETAARLGIPEGTVKSRVYYALRTLNAILRTKD
ncbi:sigma-70 family RNA polymerase sigma factor [Micromonospora sp. NPDC049366]|uniref:sigma-70 family RNA polymerase sigma factor n=1 Tax=Micromonospora sp. NPDC049366 TaxID=3364271 RepID=UPI003798A0CC